jgi:capsular exopolysaccharide synthesis family protein
MSRNFELLKSVAGEQAIFARPRSQAAPSKGRKSNGDLEPRAHEERSYFIPCPHALSGAEVAEAEGKVLSSPASRVAPGNGKRSGLDLEAIAERETIKLVQRVFLLPGSAAPRMVLFCGVGRGDGSSWVCLRASEALASQGKASVCVVDANWHAPFLHKYFRSGNSRGLADAVLESAPMQNYTHRVQGGNLWAMTCGLRTSETRTLLTSDHIEPRLAELRAIFDYVLIDAPPVNLYSDAALLGRLVDGVVLVVQANSTHREVVRKAKETLEAAKICILGAVLNKRTFPIPEFWYRKL